MIGKVLAVTVALAIAVAVGWALASTEPAHIPLDNTAALALAQRPISEGLKNSEQSLATLYDRSAWSAVKPVADKSEDSQIKEPLVFEGLDRFRLLGLLKESGVAEVLLKDMKTSDGEQTVFRAVENDNLRDSGVILKEIGNQKIYLEQGKETQELFLFPRSPNYGRDE